MRLRTALLYACCVGVQEIHARIIVVDDIGNGPNRQLSRAPRTTPRQRPSGAIYKPAHKNPARNFPRAPYNQKYTPNPGNSTFSRPAQLNTPSDPDATALADVLRALQSLKAGPPASSPFQNPLPRRPYTPPAPNITSPRPRIPYSSRAPYTPSPRVVRRVMRLPPRQPTPPITPYPLPPPRTVYVRQPPQVTTKILIKTTTATTPSHSPTASRRPRPPSSDIEVSSSSPSTDTSPPHSASPTATTPHSTTPTRTVTRTLAHTTATTTVSTTTHTTTATATTTTTTTVSAPPPTQSRKAPAKKKASSSTSEISMPDYVSIHNAGIDEADFARRHLIAARLDETQANLRHTEEQLSHLRRVEQELVGRRNEIEAAEARLRTEINGRKTQRNNATAAIERLRNDIQDNRAQARMEEAEEHRLEKMLSEVQTHRTILEDQHALFKAHLKKVQETEESANSLIHSSEVKLHEYSRLHAEAATNTEAIADRIAEAEALRRQEMDMQNKLEIEKGQFEDEKHLLYFLR